MLSRILWVSVAGLALIVGIALQDGDRILGWIEDTEISAKAEGAITDRVEHAVERSVDKMEVVGSDGQEIEVPAEAKRAMADAVAQLVKAEAELAIARVGDGSDEEMQVARTRRDEARAEIDRLKVQFEKLERASRSENDALREQIRREIREDIRASVQESVAS